METRILIPKGLRAIVLESDGEKQTRHRKSSIRSCVDDENEKPSSSSGQCDTVSDQEDKQVIAKRGRKYASFSSLSETSLSSESDSEIETFNKVSQHSEDEVIGSSEIVSTEDCKNPGRKKQKKRRNNSNDEDVHNSNHNRIKICADSFIEKGTLLQPDDGDVQIVHLKGITAISKDDVRYMFGCFESFAPIPHLTPTPTSPLSGNSANPTCESGYIRLCNWVRFLPTSERMLPHHQRKVSSPLSKTPDSPAESLSEDDGMATRSDAVPKRKKDDDYSSEQSPLSDPSSNNEVSETHFNTPLTRHPYREFSNLENSSVFASDSNIIGFYAGGRPIFEVTKRLVPGTELLPYFNVSSVFEQSKMISSLHASMMMANPSQTEGSSLSSARKTISPPSSSQFPLPRIVSSPFTSTSISSSSSFGGLKDKDKGKEMNCEENGQQQEKPPSSTRFPISPFQFNPNYQLLPHQHYYPEVQLLQQIALHRENLSKQKDKGIMTIWQSNRNDLSYAKQMGISESKKTGDILEEMDDENEKRSGDAPLDLSNISKSTSKTVDLRDYGRVDLFTVKSEPLTVGTPFDSPDSNDNDVSIPMKEEKEGFRDSVAFKKGQLSSPNLLKQNPFFIRNVLKHKFPPSPPPTTRKLFQPYSFDDDQDQTPAHSTRETHVERITSFMSVNVNSRAASVVIQDQKSHSPVVQPPTMSMMRPILRTRGRERSLLPCDVCGKAFDRPSLLKRHLRTHTGEKPHICDVCTKGFSTSSSLNTHRRIHSGEKPHQCGICGKRFTASSNLYYHRMTHNKEKPHKCMLCGKSFPTPGDLKSHQYVHSGSWPFSCPVCHRGFSKQTNLRNHLLLHNGMGSNSACNKAAERSHACHLCDKKFSQASNLRSHMKTHEEEVICTVCKRNFPASSNMLINDRCRSCHYNSTPLETAIVTSHEVHLDACRRPRTITPRPNSFSPLLLSTDIKPPSLNLENSIATAPQSKILSPQLQSLGQLLQTNPNSLSSLTLPQLSTGISVTGLPTALSLTGNTLTAPTLHFPSAAVSSSIQNQMTAAASLFRSSSGTPSNPIFEHLFGLNYYHRFAKETAGNLMMQQKLLESQVLAAHAQFMNSQVFGMGNGNSLQDILRLKAAASGSDGFRPLDAVTSERKFMQRQ